MEGNGLLDLANKKVVHETFGKGNVIDNSERYIKVDFEAGVKRFIFPDVFDEFMTLTDETMAGFVEEKLEEKEKQMKIEAIKLKKEKAEERERQLILEREKEMRNRKIHPELQSVFWLEEDEVEKVFEEGKVFIGRFKSGKKEGEPRRLARVDQNSACLLTKRGEDVKEEDRSIVGLFMVEKGFDGRECKDGYIPAYSEHILRLSKEESDKILFWNYYKDKNAPDDIVWKSGRQRYYDNNWTAQILNDIVSLREESEGQEAAKKFFEYFCKINLIDIEKIPKPEGALMKS